MAAKKTGTAVVACAGLAGLGFVASDSGNRRVPVAAVKASPEVGSASSAFTVGTAAATAGAMAASTRRSRASRVASHAEVAPGEASTWALRTLQLRRPWRPVLLP